MRVSLRGARLLVRGALVLWALWVVPAQVLLWTPLLRGLVGLDPNVHLRYGFAWSVWPGTVHVRGFRLVAEDSVVQWQLDVDEATTSIALTDLPRRAFHTHWIRARGVAFALRRKLPAEEATRDRLVGLPPIEGLMWKPRAYSEDVPDSRYKMFTVWLEDVEGLEVRQIRFDRLRLDGPAEVAGAFYLKPNREVLIAPAVLKLAGATLSVSGQGAAEQMSGDLALHLGPFDPRGATLASVARVTDLEIEGSARFLGFAFLRRDLSGGEGPLRSALHVKSGRVQEGSSFSAQLAELRSPLGRLGSATLAVDSGAETAQARLDVRDLRASGARAAQLLVELSGDLPDLAELVPPRHAVVDLRGGRVANARGLPAPRGVSIDDGWGGFSAHLEGPAQRLAGQARLALMGVRGRAEGVVVGGDLSLDIRVAALDPLHGADLSGTRLSVGSAHLINPGGEMDAAPGWWGRFLFPRARLLFAPAPAVDADLTAHCRDARPIVGLYVRRSALPGFVAGLFNMDNLSVRGSARATRDSFALRDLSASGEGASVRGVWQAENGHKRGAALLTVHGLSVALELGEGGSSVHLLKPGSWFNEQEARLQPEQAPLKLPHARRSTRRR
jgi:hypothetical protein